MTPKNIAIEPELLERAGKVAEEEGKTVDQLATEGLKRELARRWSARIQREAAIRRGTMTDDEVEAVVDQAICDYRREHRGR